MVCSLISLTFSPSLFMSPFQVFLFRHLLPGYFLLMSPWERKSNLLLIKIKDGVTTLEESLAVLQNIKQNYHMLKARQHAQNGVAHTKPHITKLKLNYSFSSPGNGILNLSIRNQHQWRLTDPCIPERKVTLSQQSPLQYSCLENLMDGGAW